MKENFDLERLKNVAALVCEDSNRRAEIAGRYFKDSKQNKDVFLGVLDDADVIAQIYSGYRENDKFLYRPSRADIERALANDSIYVGAYDKNRNLMGLAKLEKLSTPTPFFIPPKSEDPEGSFYGSSGLYVLPQYRGNNVARVLVENRFEVARQAGATGIYGDFDYRNVRSGKVLTKFYDTLIGCTDGTEGAKGEDTTYITLYKSFENADKAKSESENPIRVDLDMRGKTPQEASEEIVDKLQQLDNVERFDVPYGEGFNKIYVTDNANPMNINLTQDPVQ